MLFFKYAYASTYLIDSLVIFRLNEFLNSSKVILLWHVAIIKMDDLIQMISGKSQISFSPIFFSKHINRFTVCYYFLFNGFVMCYLGVYPRYTPTVCVKVCLLFTSKHFNVIYHLTYM